MVTALVLQEDIDQPGGPVEGDVIVTRPDGWIWGKHESPEAWTASGDAGQYPGHTGVVDYPLAGAKTLKQGDHINIPGLDGPTRATFRSMSTGRITLSAALGDLLIIKGGAV